MPSALRPLGGVDRRALGVAGAAAAGAAGLAALLRWRLWAHGVPDTPVPPVDAYFDADALGPNRDYRRGVWAMAGAGAVLAPAVAVAVALTGRRWRGRLVRLAGGRTWRAGLLFGAGFSIAGVVAALPLRGARYAWGRHHGIIVQDAGPWLADVAKGAAIGAGIAAAVGAGAAVLIARAPRTWWLGLAGAVAALVYAGSLLAPVLIEPLFQRTRPLQDRELAAQVLELARRQGVSAERVLVNDASSRTVAANAYVSGLGASRRIVLYDTLLRDFPRDQVLVVVAHELAHVRHRHVLKGTTWGAVMAAPVCLLAFALVGARTGWGRPGAGRDGADLVVRRLAIVAATASVAAALAAPLGNVVSRAYEREADWTALRTAQDPAATTGLFQGFVRRSLGVPDPPRAYQLWFGSHPTPIARIGMAEEWARRRQP
ncbi:MAG TPA: M48 family metalloprotease [Miltoncostaeaceae bacterium]|nr:M48 family metalloprotease [Miltoncostaeaceae bacterium]